MDSKRLFANRKEAGKELGLKLKEYKGREGVVVIAIPRGGVVVGKEVSNNLSLPLDIIVVKKIGALHNLELAIGAVGKNIIYWDKSLLKEISALGKDQMLVLGKLKEDERRKKEKILRNGKKAIDLKDKVVILIDDGVATGATVITASKVLRKEKAKKVILAVPVISKDTLEKINQYFDDIISLSVEESFYAVGQFYLDFPQVEDEEAVRLL